MAYTSLADEMGNGWGSTVSSGDLDGDELTDLAFWVIDADGPTYDDTVTSSRLVMGWDLPWDDPFYW